MAKLTNKSTNDTSFHFTTIRTTVNTLTNILGEAQCIDNTGDDKVNFNWDCETKNGDVFTIYDWKKYRPIGLDEIVEFHIGGENGTITEQAKKELLEILN